MNPNSFTMIFIKKKTEKLPFKMLSAQCYLFCSGLNVLTLYVLFFLRENINIYLHFLSFLHTNKTQVVEIPPRVRQGPAYST